MKDTESRLQLFINLVYDGQGKALADALGIHPSIVTRWRQGREIKSGILAQMLQLGLNINWLLDPTNTDVREMFMSNEAGKLLYVKHFGEEMKETKPSQGK